MKTLTITPPDGHEIDKDKSSFQQIVFKKIEKKLPLSAEEIPNRDYTVINLVSKDKRANAFVALMDLVELRDAWNGDWKADWENFEQNKHVIYVNTNKIRNYTFSIVQNALHFKSSELRDKFAEQFKDLIEQAKELI